MHMKIGHENSNMAVVQSTVLAATLIVAAAAFARKRTKTGSVPRDLWRSLALRAVRLSRVSSANGVFSATNNLEVERGVLALADRQARSPHKGFSSSDLYHQC